MSIFEIYRKLEDYFYTNHPYNYKLLKIELLVDSIMYIYTIKSSILGSQQYETVSYNLIEDYLDECEKFDNKYRYYIANE